LHFKTFWLFQRPCHFQRGKNCWNLTRTHKRFYFSPRIAALLLSKFGFGEVKPVKLCLELSNPKTPPALPAGIGWAPTASARRGGPRPGGSTPAPGQHGSGSLEGACWEERPWPGCAVPRGTAGSPSSRGLAPLIPSLPGGLMQSGIQIWD